MNYLSESQKRHLRGLAHHLKPVVQMGAKGLTDAVLMEIERALHDHELIKVKLNPGDREQRAADVAGIVDRTGAELVQRIGNVACLYRRHPEEPSITLPA